MRREIHPENLMTISILTIAIKVRWLWSPIWFWILRLHNPYFPSAQLAKRPQNASCADDLPRRLITLRNRNWIIWWRRFAEQQQVDITPISAACHLSLKIPPFSSHALRNCTTRYSTSSPRFRNPITRPCLFPKLSDPPYTTKCRSQGTPISGAILSIVENASGRNVADDLISIK